MTLEDMLHELCAEVEMRGSIDQLSPAFREDFCWRLSQLYETLPEGHEDREWFQITAAVVLCLVPAGTFVEHFGPLLEGDR